MPTSVRGTPRRSRPARRSTAVLYAATVTALAPVTAAPLPSIGARHVTVHEPSGTTLRDVEIELSPAGLRVRDSGPEGSNEMLQDFVGERAWLIDRRRKVVLELPFFDAPNSIGEGASTNPEPGPSDDPPSTAEQTPDRNADDTSVRGGFLGREPCLDRDARAEGNGTWRSRPVDVYSCLGADGRSVEAVEFIDHEFPVVIYREDGDGRIDSLQDLRSRVYGESHFVPEATLRPVREHEYFFGAPPIGSFEERPAPTR